MYKDFYGFKDFPFGLAPDPRYFFPGHRHQEALDCLLYTIEQKKGFCVVTGPVGSGKTTLCRTFMQKLDPETEMALITHTLVTGKQLIINILKDFNVVHDDRRNKAHLLSCLYEFLIDNYAHNRDVVLIIDEAQNLSPKVLEEVRLISNLESDEEKLIQIILLGQPELYTKLRQHNLRQLRQRVAVQIQLEPFTREETAQYIRHRLKLAGSNGHIQVTEDAIDLIHQQSRGLPRLINIIGDAVLLSGYALQNMTVDRTLVEQVIQDEHHNFSIQPDLEPVSGVSA